MELPQQTDISENPTSVLKDLRVLLAVEVFGLMRSSQQVRILAESANNALNNNAASTVHDDVVSILDYLDGASFVRADIPTGQDLLVEARQVETPLRSLSAGQSPAGFVTTAAVKLQSLLTDPGITPNMTTLARESLNALTSAQGYLDQVHDDARQLVSMSNAQLLQPVARSLINSLLVSARYADEGQTNATTDGIAFAGNTIQRLPAINISSYKP